MEKETKIVCMYKCQQFLFEYTLLKIVILLNMINACTCMSKHILLNKNNTSMHKYSKAVVFVFIWVKGSVMIF